MARQLRIEYPGAFYHITSRGNEKKNVFLCEKDRKKFLEILKEARERFRVVIHVFCLMENHYHLLLETPSGNLSKIMHFINTSYTVYFNKRHQRIGHLFQGRYKAILVDADGYAQELSRYIHLNPVRAGIVEFPEQYPWSSYRDYISFRTRYRWLKTDFILGYFGKKTSEAQSRYSSFVTSLVRQNYKSPLEDLECSAILGSKNFIEYIKKTYLRDKKEERELPALKELQMRPTMARIQAEVEKIIGRKVKSSKKMAIFLSHKYTDTKLREIGKFFGLSESAATQVSLRMRAEILKDINLDCLIKEIEKKLFLSDV